MLKRLVIGITTGLAACTLFSAVTGCGGHTSQIEPVGDDAAPAMIEAGGAPDAMPSADAGSQDALAPVPDAGQTLPPLSPVNKVDILFDIDNSASMGDKQAYLARAIPDLITRLSTPNCVDSGGNASGVVSDANGNCSIGTVEFPPVRDMHIGIVSSALGPRLGNVCPTTGVASQQPLAGGGTIDRHNDDQGHLLNRASDPNNLSNYTETALPDTGTVSYLDWFPPAAGAGGGGIDGGIDGGMLATGAVAITDPAKLATDFQGLVTGVHAFGCGIESQLESWYRFLIQPDPYASLAVTSPSGGKAQWVGVDTVLLAQRADFLRPDSLVAVIVLSDENDSEVDVRSFGGTGWNFMSSSFSPPRGTSACATTPNDPACTSCSFGTNPSDPQCQLGTYSAATPTDWGYDLNLRHVHQKQKYGVSVQFPIQRYVLGLTSPRVPDRTGEYPVGASSYQGLDNQNLNCTNPLFAAQLPAPPAGVDPSQWHPTAAELCNLPPGTRTAGYVYYSHIGGVPHQLLQEDPTDPSSPQKVGLTAADWTRILGADPVNLDYTGIDPHMVESYQPRDGLAVPDGGFPAYATTAPEGMDPISGREWITNSTMPLHQGLLVDREYACTFRLDTPRQCDNAATAVDPTLQDSCDCQPPTQGAFTHDQIPAVCNDSKPTQQDSAKAYPTIRELLLAKLLGQVPGANEGVISSICPIHTVEGEAGDPLFGYRPAMSAIVSRLKRAL